MMLEGHKAIVRAVCFNPTNDLNLLSGGEGDTEIKVWDTETGKNIANLEGHSEGVVALKTNADGLCCASVSKDKTLRLWDLRSSSCAFAIDCKHYSEMNDVALSSGYKMGPRSAQAKGEAPSGGSYLAAVGHNDGMVSVWDLSMRKCVKELNQHIQAARSVSYNVDGKFLASAGFDSMIRVMDSANNLSVVKTLSHEDKVVCVRWHPFLPMLLSTSADKTARLWMP